jgi:hypothetical protein
VAFFLTPQASRSTIPTAFSPAPGHGGMLGRIAHSTQVEAPCSHTFRVGPFNASIPNASPTATGSVWAWPILTRAPIVARRCIACPRRSGRACGCVLARSASIAPRARRADARATTSRPPVEPPYAPC